MKSIIFLLAKLMSIAVVTVLLLSVGVEPASAAGFPKPLPCRPSFVSFPWAPRLCIDQFPQSATDFDTAMLRCRNRFAYVASYGDLYYLQWGLLLIMQTYNPNGKWIGPDLVGDNEALIGNGGGMEDFEGTGSKFDVRSYWCAHDVE